MDLSPLTLLHLRKNHPGEGLDEGLILPKTAWCLDTCQRILVAFPNSPAQLKDAFAGKISERWEWLEGPSAYQLLLEISCGLHSALVGETEIFGQIKQAWNGYESHARRTDECGELRAWFRHLFEDTKRIRTEHMQGFGGSSYGSLIRKVLRPNVLDPILVIGAGHLAESVVPYLEDAPVTIWNRSSVRALALVESRRKEGQTNIRVVDRFEDLDFSRFAHVLVCIPRDLPLEEQVFSECFDVQRPLHSRIVHFGCGEADQGPLQGISGFLSLGSVFSIKDRQNHVRSIMIDRVERAIREALELRFQESALTYEARV